MPSKGTRIAAQRPPYLRDLAQGLERFFEPRREDCPWCSGRDLRRRLHTTDLIQRKPGSFTLEQCHGCGHVFQNPRLNAQGLEFYYRDCYDGLNERAMERLASSRICRKLYRARARALVPFGRPSRWLDVGTGHGHFCSEARSIHPTTRFHGLDRGEGVEIAARTGRITHAYQGSFTDLSGQLAGRYDVVSMHHYLEHTIDPRRELAAARTALRPGGHLLIEVPDPQCLSARLLGRWWVPWLQPQHLHLIPLRNLRGALEQHDFTIKAVDRREPHVPTDLVAAALNLLNSALPGEDLPWLPAAPGRISRLTRALAYLSAAPLLLALFGLDTLLAPLARRTRLSNAYRVVACRN
ncbi:class I SAM-dependent methyltransferase [Streptomyces sp. NPDC050355]|uniref:class I SAM-dependent methyltransferase n=1 Tax=Streptomyces sp. NPDC050355 TaxID=3365609 RepID=UPI0037A95950